MTLPIPCLKEGKMNIQPTVATVASLPPQSNAAGNSATREIKAAGETTLKAVARTPLLPPAEPPEREKVEAATKIVRDFVEPINSNLEFSLDDDTGQMVVKIIDRATKEVIRQMPSEEMLAVAKALDSIKGLFVKQTA
jgi:flagellar protein FlaG